MEDNTTSPGIPFGRRVPRGRLRWYLARCHEGYESATIERIRSILPKELLQDAFVPRRERQRKVHGVWKTSIVDMFPGYFVVATADALALSKALAKLTFPVQLVGGMHDSYAPIDADAQQQMEQLMDRNHVIRLSWGEIVDDVLHVTSGPLLGMEEHILSFNRHRADAQVCLSGSVGNTGRFVLRLPLAIPVRRTTESGS